MSYPSCYQKPAPDIVSMAGVDLQQVHQKFLNFPCRTGKTFVVLVKAQKNHGENHDLAGMCSASIIREIDHHAHLLKSFELVGEV